MNMLFYLVSYSIVVPYQRSPKSQPNYLCNCWITLYGDNTLFFMYLDIEIPLCEIILAIFASLTSIFVLVAGLPVQDFSLNV